MKRCRQCRAPLEGPMSKFLGALTRLKPSTVDPTLCNKCAPASKKGAYVCQICNRSVDEKSALTHVKTEEYLLGLIKKDHPEWKEEEGTCPACVAYYRDLIQKGKI